jgi:putative salt-induced outer membrane protein YdiY
LAVLELRAAIMGKGRCTFNFRCFILLVILISACAKAEEVTLVAGDVLHGRIINKSDTSITLLHDVLGKLEIPRSKIASMALIHDVLGEVKIPPDQVVSSSGESDKPRPEETGASDKHLDQKQAEKVTLLGRDILYGGITKKTDLSITLIHDVFGELEIPRNQIAGITVVHNVLGEIEIRADHMISSTVASDEKQKTEETPAVPKHHTEKQEGEERVWFEPQFQRLNAWAARTKKKGWSASVDFSINTNSGQKNDETTRLGAHIERTLRDERLAVDTTYYHKTSEGRTTDNKFTSGFVQDYLQPGSPWFYFVLGRYDYDQFQSWKQRANIQLGPAYNLIKSDYMLLDLRAGAGARKEWQSDNTGAKLEGLVGLDFIWKLTKKQSFDTTAQYYPVLSDFNDYRTRLIMNWRYLLAQDMNLSLLAGLVREYQSIVDPGSDNTDTRVFVGIQMRFE